MRALLQLWTKDQGGRHTPAFEGYAPEFRAGTDGHGDVHLGAAVVHPPETNPLLVPGTDVEVELAPVDAAAWVGVTTNLVLGVFEDDRQVGTARVLAT